MKTPPRKFQLNIKPYIVLFRSVLIITMCFFLGACTHSRLVKNADIFQNEARYELAADYYRQALALRPNNRNTQERLRFSEVAFDHWLVQLEEAAELAYQNEDSGKALLMYGKLAAHSNDSEIIDRYEALLGRLTNFAQYYAWVDYNPEVFGTELERGINDLISLNNTAQPPPSALADNEQIVSFNYNPGQFSLREEEVFESVAYISGYILIDNPEFISLQRSLPGLRSRIRESRFDTRRYRDIVRGYERELNHLENNNHSQHRSRERNDSAENEQDNDTIRQINSRLSRARRKQRQYRHELESRQRQLERSLDRMSYIPLTIEEEVYSDHIFPVIESTLTLKGQLLINNSGSQIEQGISVESFDRYYESQDILGMPAKHLQHESNQQLEQALQVQARNQARSYLNQMVTNYRQGLLTQANSSLNRREHLEKLVLYGLSGNSGVSSAVSAQMVQQLQWEVGVGGEFTINDLLHPY